MMRHMLGIVAGLTLVSVMSLSGCQSTTGKTAGQTIDDAAITASVQKTLTSDRASNFTRIDVDTERGTVNLSGVVKSAEQKSRATELAQRVDGVKRVNNNLQIEGQSTSMTR